VHDFDDQSLLAVQVRHIRPAQLRMSLATFCGRVGAT